MRSLSTAKTEGLYIAHASTQPVERSCQFCGYPVRPKNVNPACCAEHARQERANLAMRGGDA